MPKLLKQEFLDRLRADLAKSDTKDMTRRWSDGSVLELLEHIEATRLAAQVAPSLAGPEVSDWVMRQNEVLPGGVVQSIYQDAAGKLHVVRSNERTTFREAEIAAEALERWHSELHPETAEHACDEKNCTFRRCFDKVLKIMRGDTC